MRNKIVDLNNHLFAQLERLGEEDLSPEVLEQEIKRSKAICEISKNIVESTKVTVQAMKLMESAGYDISKAGSLLIEAKNEE